MSRRRPRSPFEPIRVPAGAAGDAIIDMLCEACGTTREEARKRGEESMRTMISQEMVEVRPYPPFVPRLMFVNHRGEMDDKAWAAAQARAEADYVECCAELGLTP